LRLEVVAHPDYGLPYGQDRLIPLWVATEAVRQKSRHLTFRWAADLLRAFGLPLDGIHYRRLAEGFKRVFTSTFYFGSQSESERSQSWNLQRIHFFDEAEIWCARNPVQPAAGAVNALVLSERFWDEIRDHPIPVDLGVVRGIVNNPGCLDFYTWLSWRSFVCRHERDSIPLFGPRGLCSQLGVESYTRPRNLRKRIREWLRIVKMYWPECSAELPEAADHLVIKPPRQAAVRSRTYAHFGFGSQPPVGA
jgi:hypothetical protein